jgi:hypothetical protein
MSTFGMVPVFARRLPKFGRRLAAGLAGVGFAAVTVMNNGTLTASGANTSWASGPARSTPQGCAAAPGGASRSAGCKK